jgi:hypothetical protein
MERPVMISVIGPQAETRRDLMKALTASLRKRGYQETDLILLDNELSSEILKIEIAYEFPRAKEDLTVFAIIGSKKFRLGRPEFHAHEIDELADYLIEQFLKTHLLE